jgi:hypothetical protein
MVRAGESEDGSQRFGQVRVGLILYRYHSFRQEHELAAVHLSRAIDVALEPGWWTEAASPSGYKESQRRLMWALYIEDRYVSCRTGTPYRIKDNLLRHLPSPFIYLAPNGTRLSLADASRIAVIAPSRFIASHRLANIARYVTRLLDNSSAVGWKGLSEASVAHLDEAMTYLALDLPGYLQVLNIACKQYDAFLRFLPAQRVRLHSYVCTILSILHQARLSETLDPAGPIENRQRLAKRTSFYIQIQLAASETGLKRLVVPMLLFEACASLAVTLFVGIRTAADPEWDYMKWILEGSCQFLQDCVLQGRAPDVDAKRLRVVEALKGVLIVER